jgi:hypothetical protein
MMALRRGAYRGDGLKQLEACVAQQQTPVIVEAAVRAHVAPYFLIAHSANYISLVIHEAAFSAPAFQVTFSIE